MWYLLRFTLVIFACTLCINNELHAQNYIEYQRIFNRVDRDIKQQNFTGAVQRLDSIIAGYDFIYARHCMKALKISCIANDSIRANIWLRKAAVQGVRLWMIRASEVTKPCLYYSTTRETIQHYDSLTNIYQQTIDTGVKATVDALIKTDQKHTLNVNSGSILSIGYHYIFKWKPNNKHSFALLMNLTKTYGFPAEQLIGLPDNTLDSATSYKHYKHYGAAALVDHRAYTMLTHYFSTVRPPLDTVLLHRNILSGHIAPYQYGAINDFISEYGKANKHYYNVWHYDPDTGKNINEINKRRHTIGLDSFHIQKQNKEMTGKRLKEHTMGKHVLLEQ